MFPNEKHEQAKNSDDDLDTMASIMHVETPESSPAKPKEKLEELQKKFDIDKEKLKVDEDDLLNDAITYYKSAKFDPQAVTQVV